jgi:hypothetical protein
MADPTKRVSVQIIGEDDSSEAMLSARESARLFNEEVGLHLPRGLTSAIAQTEVFGTALKALSGPILAIGAAEFGFEGIMHVAEEVKKIAAAFTEVSEEEKKAAEEAGRVGEEIRKGYEEAAKIADEVRRISMTPEQRATDAFETAQGQQESIRQRIENLKAQRAMEEATIAANRRTTAQGSLTGGGDLEHKQAADQAKETIKAIDEEIRKLNVDFTKADELTQKALAEMNKLFGDDAKKQVEEFQKKVVDAVGTVEKMIGSDTSAMQKAIDLTQAQNVLGKTGVNYGPMIAAAWTKLGNDSAVAYVNSLMAKVQAESEQLKQAFASFGFDSTLAAGIAPPADFASSFGEMRAKLESEREAERLLSTQLQQQGYDRVAAEQMVGDARSHNLTMLTTELDRLEALAGTDETQLAQVQKIRQELQILGTQSHAVASQMMHDFHDDLGSAFVGIVSDTETVGQAFRNMAQHILADLAKMVFETMIWKDVLGALNNSDFFSSLAGGTLFGSGGVFGGHAGGGPVQAGMPGLINETGASEVFIPNVDGRIVPASDFARDGGGRGGDTYIINAPGADAGSEERIMSIMRAFAPTLLAQAVVQNDDYARRTR